MRKCITCGQDLPIGQHKLGNHEEGTPEYNAMCDSCGVKCSVPFTPSPNRPVYCRDCYKKQRRF